MNSVPDQSPAQQPSLGALRQQFPDWTIEPPGALHVWTAELRSADGRSLHYLCGHDIGELAARLEVAAKVTP